MLVRQARVKYRLAGRAQANSLQKEARQTQNTPLLTEAQSATQAVAPCPQRNWRKSPGRRTLPGADGCGRISVINCAKLKSKTANPVADGPNAKDHHVHHHRMSNVLGPGKTHLDHRKAGLHKENQETGNERP